MELMDDETEKVIRALTRLAKGDIGLVRAALRRHGDQGIDPVIEFILAHQRDSKAA
jgi:hypothetical protein